jgi:THO complex subunit 1
LGAQGHTAEREFYFPGFLTSTKLISLELQVCCALRRALLPRSGASARARALMQPCGLQDPVFRRHVLVQYLIVLHYLADRAAHPPKTPEIPKKQREELPKLQERCYKLLGGIPPRGGEFVKTLRRILTRENNWATWKKNKCEDFTIDREAAEPGLSVGDKRKALNAAANVWKQCYFDKNKRQAFVPKTFENGDILEICKPKDREKADEPWNSSKLEKRLDQVREDADPENYIEDEYRKNNIPQWRWVTMRLLLTYDFMLFGQGTAELKFLEGVVKHMDEKDEKNAANGARPGEEAGKDAEEQAGDDKGKEDNAGAEKTKEEDKMKD